MRTFNFYHSLCNEVPKISEKGLPYKYFSTFFLSYSPSLSSSHSAPSPIGRAVAGGVTVQPCYTAPVSSGAGEKPI